METRETRTRGKVLAFPVQSQTTPTNAPPSPPPRLRSNRAADESVRGGERVGIPVQRHARKIHLAGETLPLRADSEISFTTGILQPLLRLLLLPREFSRALIYQAYNVVVTRGSQLMTNYMQVAKFNSRSKRFVPLRETRINFCDKNYNTKYYFGRYFIRRRSDWRIK